MNQCLLIRCTWVWVCLNRVHCIFFCAKKEASSYVMTQNVSACFYVYVVQEVQKLRASLVIFVIKPSSTNASICERVQIVSMTFK